VDGDNATVLPTQTLEEDILTIGKTFMVPEILTFWVVAPVLTNVILPEGVPVALEVVRT
jgi:hypothetical protein